MTQKWYLYGRDLGTAKEVTFAEAYAYMQMKGITKVKLKSLSKSIEQYIREGKLRLINGTLEPENLEEAWDEYLAAQEEAA